MKITEEQLSAFIDDELSAREMEAVREALVEDEHLADRLAELIQVDTLVAQAYSSIDLAPMSKGVSDALTAHGSEAVKRYPRMQVISRIKSRIQSPLGQLATAASLMLVTGLLVFQYTASPTNPSWQEISAALESTPSGNPQQLADGSQLTPQLSFADHYGTYCRVYQISNEQQHQQNLACRNNGNWQLTATSNPAAVDESGVYLPASHNSSLNAILDDIISNEPFDQAQEEALIDNQWHGQAKP